MFHAAANAVDGALGGSGCYVAAFLGVLDGLD
jgi:hypothetical protein